MALLMINGSWCTNDKMDSDLTALNGRRCEIYYDKYAGYYLNVWIDGKDTYDYLQDTLEIAT